jgi:thioredoxin reductase (NADPH)
MILRIYAVVIGLATLLAGALVLGESPLLSPGPISPTHAELELECRACHSPFQGASAGCESCHGALAPENAHADAGIECSECHREHGSEHHGGGSGNTQAAHTNLATQARDDCTGCHAHASIEAVAAHAIAETMTRHVDAGSSQRAEAGAFRSFSHVMHFEEAEISGDPNCKSCHFVGESAEATRGGEQLVRWSACRDCHDDWEAAGFENAAGGGMVTLELERFERVAFSHSDEHLEVGCEDCHVGIRKAESLDDAAEVNAAADLVPCFGCHVHQPEGATWALVYPETGETADSAYMAASVAECLGCHQFHGQGGEADFPEAPADEHVAESWDVWGRAANFTVTPWLILFLGLGGTGWVITLRRLPAARRWDATADPDVAPQRIPEVPVLSPFYETSVSGIYIIGELAGVPLVNRAMKSGFDVVDFIANRLGSDRAATDDEAGAEGHAEVSSQDDNAVGSDGEEASDEQELDLLIAGSGPAGLGAATRAQSLGLSYVVCEKSTAAATIRDYPRAKIIQAAPVDIPDYGSFFQEDDESKDALVRRWEDIIARTGVVMREREEVQAIQPQSGGGFVVEVRNGKQYRTRSVVLAIGMRGTPRRLGVAGETSERVAYNLIDAAEFRERDILVVGGGNAAVEAALALSQPELLNRVRLSIRGPVLKGITPQNSSDVDAAAAEGQLEIVGSSKMGEIREQTVTLSTPEGEVELQNDMIFAMIGAELPIGFLKTTGIKLARKGGI